MGKVVGCHDDCIWRETAGKEACAQAHTRHEHSMRKTPQYLDERTRCLFIHGVGRINLITVEFYHL